MLRFNPFKSMTVQGAVAAVTPYILNALDVAAFSPQLVVIITGVGVVWSMIGARNAIEKVAGKAVADLVDGLVQRAGSTK